MDNDQRTNATKKRMGIIALIIIVIISLFVIFFYPSDAQDPAEVNATDPVITVTKENQ